MCLRLLHDRCGHEAALFSILTMSVDKETNLLLRRGTTRESRDQSRRVMRRSSRSGSPAAVTAAESCMRVCRAAMYLYVTEAFHVRQSAKPLPPFRAEDAGISGKTADIIRAGKPSPRSDVEEP